MEVEKDNPVGKFTDAWGWSKLDTFRQCPRKFYYQYIRKLPQKTNDAMKRGSRVHDDIDSYLHGWDSTLPEAARLWKPYIDEVKLKPTFTGEEGLGFDKDWKELSDWFQPETWLRVKMDAAWFDEKTGYVRIIDWKTGKFRVPSMDQLKLYAAVATELWEGAKEIDVEMVYIDQFPKVHRQGFKLDEIPGIRKAFEKEVANIYDRDTWDCSPSRLCRYCPYSKWNGGPCPY